MPPVRNFKYVLYHTALDFSLMAAYSVAGKNLFRIRTGKVIIGKEDLWVLLVDLFLAKVTKTILITKGIIPENLPESLSGKEKGLEILPIIYPK